MQILLGKLLILVTVPRTKHCTINRFNLVSQPYNQWSTGGRILTGAGTGAGEPQFSRGRGRGWPLKLDRGRGRGRGTLNFAGAGAGGSIPKCSQKLKPEFDNNLENCMLYFQYLNVLNVYNTFLNFEILNLSLYC